LLLVICPAVSPAFPGPRIDTDDPTRLGARDAAGDQPSELLTLRGLRCRTRPTVSHRNSQVLQALRRSLELTLLGPSLRRSLFRALARQQATSATDVGPDRARSLTDREWQVLELTAIGKTNAGIARRLGISPGTTAKHLEHIYRKLGVTSRAAAVASTRGRPAAVPSAAVSSAGLPEAGGVRTT
jgi:DNA-binding CsgD family transcriptional regulator